MADVELREKFPSRETELEQLLELYGEDEYLPSAVYIYGGPSTGKTQVTKSLLESVGINYVYINLVECYTSKILFESIVNKIAKTGQQQNKIKCDSLMEFLQNLDLLSQEISLDRYVIILDKAERLRTMEYNLLPGFLRIQELCPFSMSIIFIAELPFQKFYSKTNLVEPIQIYFPQYNKNELLEILLLDFINDTNFDEEFYRIYLNTFLSVFYRACRDLSELRYMAKVNLEKYCEPITRNECSAKDSMVLWRNISPILRSSLEVLYLRISGSLSQTFTKENLAQCLELPFYAKYLLIAAYLASYNPAKDDKRLFMKYHGKSRKTMKDIKAKSKVSELLNTQLGPKPFSFDRLLAIFYAILDEKVGFNNNLLVQVTSLVELQLLTSQSDNCNLDGQKYKCCVEFDFIQTISKMVGFNIRKYLSDFSHY